MINITESERFYVAYGDAAALNIKNAFYEGLPKGKIVCFRDDFTQGPIDIEFTTLSLRQRLAFWHKLSAVLYNVSDIDQVLEYSIEELESIPGKSAAFIWTGYSAYDQLATMWVANVLTSRNIQLFECKYGLETDVNDIIFNAAMLSPVELASTYENFELVHPMKVQQLAGEWKVLATENKDYRIMEDSNIVSADITYYENIVLPYVTVEYVIAKDIIEDILTNDPHPISDITVEFVLRSLIEKGQLEMQGSLESMYDYEVKLK